MPKLKDIFKIVKDLKPDKAIEKINSMGIGTSMDWKHTGELIKANTFAVTKVMNADVVDNVRKELQKSLENGTAFNDFKKDLTPTLEKMGYKNRADGSAWRLDTIYRTNMQSMYMHGRKKGQEALGLPYLQFISVQDKRTTTVCNHLAGKVFKADDKIWNSIYPPNHFNCRSRVRAVSENYVKSKGLKPEQSGPDDLRGLDDGFNRPPGDPVDFDTKKYPPDIKKQLDKDLKKTPKVSEEVPVNPIPDMSKLKWLNEKAKAQITDALTEFQKDFPINFKFIAETKKSKAIASYDRAFKSLRLGKKYFSQDTTLFEKKLEQQVKTGWQAKGENTIKGVIDHEMGHMLDVQLSKEGFSELLQIRKNYLKAKGDYLEAKMKGSNITSMKDVQKLLTNWEDFISEYAERDYGARFRDRYTEFNAESFTNARNSEKPSKFALQVYEVIKRELGLKK